MVELPVKRDVSYTESVFNYCTIYRLLKCVNWCILLQFKGLILEGRLRGFYGSMIWLYFDDQTLIEYYSYKHRSSAQCTLWLPSLSHMLVQQTLSPNPASFTILSHEYKIADSLTTNLILPIITFKFLYASIQMQRYKKIFGWVL